MYFFHNQHVLLYWPIIWFLIDVRRLLQYSAQINWSYIFSRLFSVKNISDPRRRNFLDLGPGVENGNSGFVTWFVEVAPGRFSSHLLAVLKQQYLKIFHIGTNVLLEVADAQGAIADSNVITVQAHN